MRTQPNDIEITAPDISDYKTGNVGIDYVHRFDSGYSGPNVTITAIVHGNELCGAIALDILLRSDIRPQKGTLTLCFCNVAAFSCFDKKNPYASRFIDEDFNRLWTQDTLQTTRPSQELSRAKEILPVIENTDLLLDLHSMSSECLPLALAGIQQKGIDLALKLGMPAHIIADTGHLSGARMRDFAPFSNQSSTKNSLLIECGQHWRQSSADVALQVALRFLITNTIIDEQDAQGLVNFNFHTPSQKTLMVTEAITITSDNFKFAGNFLGLDEIKTKGTLIGHDGDNPILSPYDNCTLIMPTSGATKGQTAVRLAREIII